MVFKPKKMDAATSLMEIMMILTIIGIVTAAGMSLSKPKDEYLTKIALYSAYTQLSSAALTIAQEGHIDYSTDLDACTSRDSSTNACTSYSTTKNLIKYSLPKAISRDASNSETADDYKRGSYESLSASNQAKYVYLQQGLCQRLANIFNLDSHNIACPASLGSATLIADLYTADYRNQTPHLYLPNGQVYYFGSNLSHQCEGGSITRNITISASDAPIDSSFSPEYHLKNSDGNALYNLFRGFDSTSSIPLKLSPNESRLALVKKALSNLPTSYQSDTFVGSEANYLAFLNYLKILWAEENNKDYFSVAIDVNGKMQSTSDYSNGPDTLNEDIFIFKVYRNGLVLPDYNSGFPREYLTAKVMIKQDDSQFSGTINKKIFRPYQLANSTTAYANIRLDMAYCYAGIAGDPTYPEINKQNKNYKSNRLSIQCTYGQSGSPATPMRALGSYNDTTGVCADATKCCVASDGSTEKCKVLINRPSFFVK